MTENRIVAEPETITIDGVALDVQWSGYEVDGERTYGAWIYSFTDTRDRLVYESGTDRVKADAAAKRALKRWVADEAIIPAAKAASLDHGSQWDARTDPRFAPVDFSKVQVGDLVWVLSYQLHRRGVVESIGRTNLKVAVVVESTGTFSRQSVKAGEVWWDALNA